MKRYWLAVLVFVLLAGFGVLGWAIFDQPTEVVAAHQANVIGWAWGSDDGGAAPMKGGIGWISFNSLNCDANEDGVADGGDCGNGPVSQYGVTANEQTGEFSGYAWSSNYGWIDFDPTGPYPEAPDYDARLVSVGADRYRVEGWARVIAAPNSLSAGNWDGWIKMSDPALNYEAVLGADNKFSGYSWGGGGKDGVVGWIKWDPWPGEEVRIKGNYILVVEKPGQGQGTVTSVDQNGNPTGDINCGSDCAETYNSPTSVWLNATAEPGSYFTDWTVLDEGGNQTDECANPALNCEVTVDQQKTVRANFRRSACNDGVDNDVPPDGLIDLLDPGCANIIDDDEFDAPPPPPPPPGDECPGGQNCPKCNDGIDNDDDNEIDYDGCAAFGSRASWVDLDDDGQVDALQCDAEGDVTVVADRFCRGNPDAGRESFNNDLYEI